MEINWDHCKGEFASDGGLRGIQVVDATAADWQQVLDFIRARAGEIDYTVDGTAAALPSEASEIIRLRSTATPSLQFRWADIDIATHFFGDDDLEFDFRPEDVHGRPQLDQLLSFVSGIGRLLRKTIVVYHEGWEVSPFFVYHPETDAIAYSRQSI